MDIFIKASSSDFGSDLSDNFNISADFGAVSPNQVTKNELALGKILSVDPSASKVTLSSNSPCNVQKEVLIDKNSSNCYSASAASYRVGNLRPTKADYSAAAFTTQDYISLDKITEIRNAAEYQEFSLSLFNKSLNCLIDSNLIDEEDQSMIKSGTAYSGSELYTFIFNESVNLDLNFIILSQDINPCYKITGSPAAGYQIEEWSIYDMITF
jgi:hypothetical protein